MCSNRALAVIVVAMLVMGNIQAQNVTTSHVVDTSSAVAATPQVTAEVPIPAATATVASDVPAIIPTTTAVTPKSSGRAVGIRVFMYSYMGVWYSGWFSTLSRAVQVASLIPQMSTLLAAVTAAGVAGPLASSNTQWTILAPTNAAFEDLLAALGVTAGELLANQPLLTAVLSYHVVPAAALNSAELANNQAYATALNGASVTVKKSAGGTVRILGAGNGNKLAVVTVANIRAGHSIIHVIDRVLLPGQ